MAEKFDINSLNTAQRQAVETLNGPVLILAGAGTGKTRTVTCRIAHMIERGVNPKGILALTFTNKAATEMAERVAGLVDKKAARAMTVSTFHSLCVRILRQDIGKLGYKENFSIYTGGDQTGLIKRLIMEYGGRKEKLEPGPVLAELSRVRNAGLGVEQIEDTLIQAVAKAYQRELKAQNAVDFDDLLILTERLLRCYPDAHEKWNKRFSYITVDEFQDTNSLQMSLLRQLVGPGHNVCVVGDDDQSIYGWRGAQISNILDFESFFPNPTVIKLEENYRCTRQVLDCANALIRHNAGRRDKTLRTNKEGKYPVRLVALPGPEDEANFIADEMMELSRREKLGWEAMAVLFRANAQSRMLEMALRELHIPYRMIGTRSFFDRREVKDLISYLQIMDNPEADLHLLRILNTPARGISSTTANLAIDHSREHKISLWATLLDEAFLNDCSTRSQGSINAFTELVTRYRELFTAAEKPFDEILDDFLKEIEYEDFVARSCKTDEERMQRMAAMGEIKDTLHTYWHPGAKLHAFLDRISLDSERDDDDIEKKKGVCLITMHAAKGLEFPHVYIVGVEQGLLPHNRSVEEGSLDEERRLFYVGITRAQDRLTMTYCAKRSKYGKEEKCSPSEFIQEIPGQMYEFVDYEELMSKPATEEECDDFFSSLHELLGDDD
ncbi:MAG: UvrD-helicase domain-containing protein [Akkermansia sp.]|nr:UvrD-helicase domain-containing protein [Akkermansia sp.]